MRPHGLARNLALAGALLSAAASLVACRESTVGSTPSGMDLNSGPDLRIVDAAVKDGPTDGSMGQADGGTSGDHVLISEISVTPAAAEFIEIYNPTAAAVDLTNYYLSDNAGYHGIA